MKNDHYKNQGIALMIVLAAVALLATLLAAFIFDIKINRFKVYNYQDKAQSRLNAEAGLTLAMARLKLYKEGRNYIAKNKDSTKAVKQEDLDYIWNIPFKYPIMLDSNANQIQKSALADFEKNVLLQGTVEVLIENSSQKINLNLLRISSLQTDDDNTAAPPEPTANSSSDDQTGSSGETDIVNIEEELVRLFKEQLEAKKAADVIFDQTYGNIDPEEMIAIIKYYVSDKDSYNDDRVLGVADRFDRANIVAKHAPMNDISELYLLPSWNDDLVNLIKDSVTVQASLALDFNLINNRSLKFLFPLMEDEDVTAFFAYRDDPKEKHYFESLKDVQTYMVDVGKVMTAEDFDKRAKEFEKAGLTFGTQATVFEVTSTGKFGRAEYTIRSTVSLPPRPIPTPTPVPSPGSDEDADAQAQATATAEAQATADGGTTTAAATPTAQPQLLLDPRILQIKGD